MEIFFASSIGFVAGFSITALTFVFFLYLAARYFKVRVLRVGIAFMRFQTYRLWGVLVELGWIPMGGFVKMAGYVSAEEERKTLAEAQEKGLENEEADVPEEEKFRNLPLFKRMLVMLTPLVGQGIILLGALLLMSDAGPVENLERLVELLRVFYLGDTETHLAVQLGSIATAEGSSPGFTTATLVLLFAFAMNYLPVPSSLTSHLLLDLLGLRFSKRGEKVSLTFQSIGMLLFAAFYVYGIYRGFAVFGGWGFLKVLGTLIGGFLMFAAIMGVVLQILGKPVPKEAKTEAETPVRDEAESGELEGD